MCNSRECEITYDAGITIHRFILSRFVVMFHFDIGVAKTERFILIHGILKARSIKPLITVAHTLYINSTKAT